MWRDVGEERSETKKERKKERKTIEPDRKVHYFLILSIVVYLYKRLMELN